MHIHFPVKKLGKQLHPDPPLGPPDPPSLASKATDATKKDRTKRAETIKDEQAAENGWETTGAW